NVPRQADVARAGRRGRAYPSSSGRRPRTKPSTEFSCYAGSFRPSAKLDADNRRTANAAVAPTRMLAFVRIVDKRSHRASDRQPSTAGTLHRWRTSSGTRARSSETAGETSAHTTGRGLLKQPYKQKPASWCCGGESESFPRQISM